MDTSSVFFYAGVALVLALLSALLVYLIDRKDGYTHESSLTSSLLFASLQIVPSAIILSIN
jgi:uncharacterized membrane protein